MVFKELPNYKFSQKIILWQHINAIGIYKPTCTLLVVRESLALLHAYCHTSQINTCWPLI